MGFLIVFILLQIPAQSRVSFCAVGDIMLDRGVRTKIKKNSVDYPFENIGDYINGFDLAFCNLECCISARGVSSNKEYCFRADTNFSKGLMKAGFNTFSLANNHIIDWGRKACLDTKTIIENNDLYALGVGENQAVARRPIIIKKKGLRFALFAYIGMPLEGIVSSQNKAGPAQATIEVIATEIKKVREQTDFIIVSLHWGNEYQHTPMVDQIQWAHKMIDAGADLIIGHHPHVLQSIEFYKNRLILYSLGNFVFDQHHLYQKQSGIFSCIFKKGKIDSLILLPVLLKEFRPGLTKDKVFSLIEEKIKKISTGFNTKFLTINNHIFLTDSTWALSFITPIKYSKTDHHHIFVYRQSIELLDTNQAIVDSFVINQDKEIKDCCVIKDSTSSHIFAILGGISEKRGNQLAHYSIKKEKITEAWCSKDQGYNPWKIITADINADSCPEIGIATYPEMPGDSIGRNRLVIYEWDGHGIHQKWFSPNFFTSFIDFDFTDIDRDGLDDLITLEPAENGKNKMTAYQWLGHGFLKYKELSNNINEPWLDNIKLPLTKK